MSTAQVQGQTPSQLRVEDYRLEDIHEYDREFLIEIVFYLDGLKQQIKTKAKAKTKPKLKTKIV
jgi:hypothetical protein